MAYIHVKDSVGNVISEGTGLAPLVVGPLNASTNEVSAPIQLTVYCDTGYKAFGSTNLGLVGTSAGKWSLCATSNGTYAPTLSIATEVTATGTNFWAKAQATSDEVPSNDATVDISVAAVIQAV